MKEKQANFSDKIILNKTVTFHFLKTSTPFKFQKILQVS